MVGKKSIPTINSGLIMNLISSCVFQEIIYSQQETSQDQKEFRFRVYIPGHIPCEEHHLLSSCWRSQLQELQRFDPRSNQKYEPTPLKTVTKHKIANWISNINLIWLVNYLNRAEFDSRFSPKAFIWWRILLKRENLSFEWDESRRDTWR